ncbi:MAG: ATP-binding protein, partial [Bacteroidota bacterium]
HILPPYWKTKLAFTLYILIFIGLLYAFRKIMLVRERLKHDLEIKELEKQKVEEVNKIKLAFFTDISHEFRTPLTLIQAPVDELLGSQNLSNDEKIQVGLVKNNTNRLLRLIDQLLQFRKINDKKLSLKPEHIELIAFLTQIIESFRGLALQKQIQLKLETKIEEIRVFMDADKLEKVIYNLLSNAFKYTKSEVTLHLKCCEDQKLIISVADNGVGIPEEDQALIFDRYYKVNAHKYGKGYTGAHGTGIGLAYSKALVEAMKGEIEVTSKLDEGSIFKMKFPVPTADQRPLHLDSITSNRPEALTNYLETNYQVDEFVTDSKGNQTTLLIVEDNEELRWTLKRRFGKHYQILEAGDGEAGEQMALKHLPDIILSDIMMPKQDGIALCGQLKKDDRTSHIPILLLTANTNEEKCLAGFNTGAEAYITKPFNFSILEARLRNILETRRRLKKYYSANIISPKKIHVPSADDQFLKKAVAIIEEQMDNSEFGVNEFAKALGMSRSVLYRKFSVLMEYPVKEFINMIRLKRAAQLFDSDPNSSVSTVAYSVGFTDAQYFSKKFKKFYHLTPTQYINQQKKTNKELQQNI